MKIIIALAEVAFNRKISLFTSKLNIELNKKLVRCYIWLRDLNTKKIGTVLFGELEMWFWRRMEKDKTARENTTNEAFLE